VLICKNDIVPRLYRTLLVVMSISLLTCGAEETEPSERPLSLLSLFPDKYVMLVGDGLFFTVTATDTSGNDIVNFVPKYTSSNTSVVNIQSDGRMMATGVGTATITANAGGKTAQSTIYVGAPTYDVASLGPPEVLAANYIDLSKIERISRFRSTVGHAFVDGSGETCRSMKHYYQPYWPDVDWTTVDIYAPASGTVLTITADGAWGKKLLLRPRDLPAMYVQIFHVNLDPGIVTDGWLDAGDHIGKHASNNTSSDIAVMFGSKEEGTLVSYFETMTDAVFDEYNARGVSSRAAAIITKQERDADPITCSGEQQFTEHGDLEDWVVLN
jgi:hypothetical protein